MLLATSSPVFASNNGQSVGQDQTYNDLKELPRDIYDSKDLDQKMKANNATEEEIDTALVSQFKSNKFLPTI